MAYCNTVTTRQLIEKDCMGWPAEEQARWLALFDPEDPLAGRPWVRQTAYQCAGVYSRYLACVRRLGMPDAVTPDGLRAFILACERQNNVPRTIAGYVAALLKIVRLVHRRSGTEIAWLCATVQRLDEAAAETPKKKNSHVVDALALYGRGKELILRAQRLGPDAGWRSIQMYRDGLWLCFGLNVPERLRALAGTRIRDIDVEARLARYGPETMKAKVESLRTYRKEVGDFLDEWLTVFRQKYDPGHDCVWIAKGGGPASAAALYMAMRKATGDLVNGGVSPHRFRDAAATFLVQAGPEHAPLATPVLGHRSERMTRHYFETADKIKASRETAAFMASGEELAAKAARAETRSTVALSPHRRRATSRRIT